jgi:PAS domain S-box-containing protein
MRRHDGVYRWYLFRAEPVHDERGNVVKWYGMNVDIEDRKRMEEALRRSEAQLADAQRLSQTGSLILIPASQQISWSEETARIYGYDAILKPTVELILQRVHPEDAAGVREQIELAAKGQTSFDYRHRLLMPDGSVKYLHVLAHAVINESGQNEIVGALTDVTAAKRAEDALRRSEAYLAEAQRLSRVGSFGWTPSTGEIHWSEESYRIFEVDPNVKPTIELVVQHVHPDDRELVQQAIEQVSQGGQDFDLTHRLLMPSGAIKYVHVLSHAVRDPSGHMEVIGALMDVTAARRAENAVRRSEAFLAEAQRLSRVGSFGWTPSTGETHWSEQSYRIFELDPRVKPTMELVMQHVYPDDIALVRQWFDLASAGEQDLDVMHRLLMADGSVKYVQVLSHALQDGSGKLEIVGAIMDITAARRAEEALRENEQRFRDYAETASDWLWESGPDHRFTQISVRLKAAGIDPASAVGMTRWEAAACVEEEPEKWRNHKTTLDAHLPFRGFDYRLSRDDGSVLYVSTSGKPKFDSEGRFLGYRGVGTDITASVRAEQAEQALQRAQTELAHVTRVTTLGELTASIAHEVNQPLAAIVANGDACLRWLGREPPNVGKARESVESMIGDGNRASQVVSRIRTLSKSSSPHQAPLNVNDVIDEVVLLVQREVMDSDVSVRLALAPVLPTVFGDRVQLQQVLINLVINGIQAMAPIVDRPRELTICSRRFEEADQVLIAVSDSGIGIDSDTANRLFDAFFTTKSSGLGMGLSICRSIVEAHGGRVWASANEGPGATFQFTLKANKEAAS